MKKLVLNSVLVGIIGIGVLVCKTPTPPWERAPEISFAKTDFVFTRGVSIDPILPSFSDTEGIAVTVDPALPAGLKLDSVTGIISATPQVASPKTDYTVTVTNLNGSTDATLSITVVPQKATSLTSLEVTEKTALLSWEQTGDADSFMVYRATSRTGDYSTAGTSLDTFYLDTGLTSETTYYYSIVTLANGVSSRRSDTIETTTSAPTIPTYTVTYHGNGNSSGEVPTDGSTYEEGAAVTVLGNSGNLALPGFTFSGWATDAAGAGTIYAADETFAMGSSNVTLYAKWVQNPTYTVTFDKNDTDATGTMDPQSIVSGLSANLTANAYTKANWYFAGWATTPDGSVEYSDEARYTMGTSDVTLYAKWTQDPIYTITFDKNDTQAEGTMTTQRIVTNTTVALSENQFTKAGWSFAGWSTTSDGSVEYADKADFTMGGADVTLYAQWTVNSYTIDFDKNDNDATGTMADQSMESGATAALSANQFSKDGWSFAGWSTTAGGSVEYTDGADFTMGTENVTLFARWTQNPTYTVIYDGYGKTSGTVPSDTNYYEQGETVTVLGNTGNLARTGYAFSGWTTDTTGNGTDYVADDTFPMGTSNVRLYAKWSLNSSYTVAFLKNNSTATGEMTPQSIVSGMSEPLKANAFTNAGWYFAGWSTVSGEASVEYSDKASYTMGTADDTLYAQWTQNELHTVTFLPNDAKAMGDTTHQSIPSGLTVTLSQNEFHKPGWSFDGWAEHPDSAKIYDNGATYTMSTANDTLYATWVANDYTISFIKDHQAATGSMNPQVIACEDSANLSPIGFTNDGYTFKGWATETGGTSVAYNDEAMFTMDTTDVTLYAVWGANQIEIVFSENDAAASGSMANQPVTYGETVQLKANTFSKSNWTFSGWGTSPTGVVEYLNEANYTMTSTSPVTLYAKWTENPKYQLVYHGNGSTNGSVPGTNSYYEGTVVTIESYTSGGLVRDGHTFDSWNTKQSGTGDTLIAGDTYTMGTEGATLYAQWVIDTFTVSFMDGSASIKDTQVVYNTLVNDFVPQKTGYTFSGWYTSLTYAAEFDFATKITAPKKIYAKFTPIPYAISYQDLNGATLSNPSTYTIEDEIVLTDPGNITGYTFDGWYTSDGTQVTMIPAGSTGPRTFYAKWIPDVYTVTFEAGAGVTTQPNPTTKTVTYPNDKIDALPSPPTKTGYSFEGWYAGTGGSGTQFFQSTTVTGDLTVFANWSAEEYSITYENLEDGTNSSNPSTYTIESDFDFSNAVRDDYAFKGWYTDANLTNGIQGISTGRTGALTVYAKWEWNVTVTDNDGNVYQTVKIGDQVWMSENFRTTSFTNDVPIPPILDATEWSTLSGPGFCFYGNAANPTLNKRYGALYNWTTVTSENFAPDGWHVPSDAEWTQLNDYLTSKGEHVATSLASDTLFLWKSTSIANTPGYNQTENNTSGFSAFPGGDRSWDGSFEQQSEKAWFWSSSQYSTANGWNYHLTYNSEYLIRGITSKGYGMSVRLVRDAN